MKRDLLSRLYDVRSIGGEWAPGLPASVELVNPDGPAAAREIERLREALRGVIRVADRDTVEFDAARSALQPKE